MHDFRARGVLSALGRTCCSRLRTLFPIEFRGRSCCISMFGCGFLWLDMFFLCVVFFFLGSCLLCLDFWCVSLFFVTLPPLASFFRSCFGLSAQHLRWAPDLRGCDPFITCATPHICRSHTTLVWGGSVSQCPAVAPEAGNSAMYESFLHHARYLAVVGLFFCFHQRTPSKTFPLLYALVAWIFSLKMSRLMVICGPIVSMLAGYPVGIVLDWCVEQVMQVLCGRKDEPEVVELPARAGGMGSIWRKAWDLAGGAARDVHVSRARSFQLFLRRATGTFGHVFWVHSCVLC